MQQPGRKFQSVTLSNAEGYRYGFNGKEKDKDVNSLTAYDYGFRIYNPAIGKFLSVDPLAQKYPWYTPYQFAGNIPIWAIDLDGLEPVGNSLTATKKSAWLKLSDDQNVKNPSQLHPLGIFATLKRYAMLDDNDDPFIVFELTSQTIGFGNKMRRVTQYFYESNLNDPHAVANFAIKNSEDGSLKLIGSIVPFESQEQVDKRTSNGVANIILGSLGAGLILPFASPAFVPAVSVTLKARVITTGVDYLAQVGGNFISGKEGLNIIKDVNATSLALSFINPGSEWKQLIANNVTASFFSISTKDGYNGVGGGKSITLSVGQSIFGIVLGAVGRGLDKGIEKTAGRLAHVKEIIGEGQLATYLQGTIRNLQSRAFKLGVVTGSLSNGISNGLENMENK